MASWKWYKKKGWFVFHGMFCETLISLAFNVIGSYLWRHVYTSHIGGAHSSPRNAHNPFLMWANHLFREIGLDMQFSGSGWGGQVFPLTGCKERNPYHLFLWLQPSIHLSLACNRGSTDWMRLKWSQRSKSCDLLNQCSLLSQNARMYMLIMTKMANCIIKMYYFSLEWYWAEPTGSHCSLGATELNLQVKILLAVEWNVWIWKRQRAATLEAFWSTAGWPTMLHHVMGFNQCSRMLCKSGQMPVDITSWLLRRYRNIPFSMLKQSSIFSLKSR